MARLMYSKLGQTEQTVVHRPALRNAIMAVSLAPNETKWVCQIRLVAEIRRERY